MQLIQLRRALPACKWDLTEKQPPGGVPEPQRDVPDPGVSGKVSLVAERALPAGSTAVDAHSKDSAAASPSTTPDRRNSAPRPFLLVHEAQSPHSSQHFQGSSAARAAGQAGLENPSFFFPFLLIFHIDIQNANESHNISNTKQQNHFKNRS